MAQALAGLRVIDFTWVGVGPLLTKYLADFGAEVIRIESRTHLDSFRYAPPFVEGRPGIERSGQFLNLNTSKSHVTLNLDHPQGRELARRLIATADVVAENFTSHVMEQWGLTYEELRQVKPDLVMISLSMEGRTGPHRDARGFGTVLQAAAGLGASDRLARPAAVDPRRRLHRLDDAVLRAGGAPGRAWTIASALGRDNTSMSPTWRSGVNCLETAILDYTVNGRIQRRAGNEWMVGDLPGAAPHGVYRCQGVNRWCAIAVWNDQEWRRFCDVLGHPAWTQEARFATVLGPGETSRRVECPGRNLDLAISGRGHHGPLTGGWHRRRRGAKRRGPGVRPATRSTAASQSGSITPRSACSATTHRLFSSAPAQRSFGPVPMLGQHNACVFKGLLGLSEAEYEAFARDGVFE